jgi:hypothetical protein
MDTEFFLKHLNERFDRLEELVGEHREQHAAIQVRLNSVERKATDASDHATRQKGARELVAVLSLVVSLVAGVLAVATHLRASTTKKEPRHDRDRD